MQLSFWQQLSGRIKYIQLGDSIEAPQESQAATDRAELELLMALWDEYAPTGPNEDEGEEEETTEDELAELTTDAGDASSEDAQLPLQPFGGE